MNHRPSFATGFAQSPIESQFPSLWQGLERAWVPGLGDTGLVLHDVSGHNAHVTFTSGTWTTTSDNNGNVYDALESTSYGTFASMGIDYDEWSFWIVGDVSGGGNAITRIIRDSDDAPFLGFRAGTIARTQYRIDSGTEYASDWGDAVDITGLRLYGWTRATATASAMGYKSGEIPAKQIDTLSRGLGSNSLSVSLFDELSVPAMYKISAFYFYSRILTDAEQMVLSCSPLAPFVMRPRSYVLSEAPAADEFPFHLYYSGGLSL